MRELLKDLQRWRAAGRAVALATVVKAWGSSPRPLGSKMAISEDGAMAGSVSGGCVDGAVVEEAAAVLASGRAKLVSYGVADETAWSVGLSCGGAIEIFIEPLDSHGGLTRQLLDEVQGERAVAVATIVEGDGIGSKLLVGDGETLGSIGAPALDDGVAAAAQRCLGSRKAERIRFETDGEARDIFIDPLLPPPTLIVVGAVHVAIHLIAFARRLGFRTVVIDPRTAFATPERFADADELVAEWPAQALERMTINESTCFVFLSHDAKIDLPGLELALAGPALYVGMLGSKKTHAKRRAELTARGVDDDRLDTLHAPIGLDLGGRRAEEIALSIMAEIVAVQHGRAC